MQSTHQIISQYSDDGKLCYEARNLGPGKLWIIIHDYDLAMRFQAEGYKRLSANTGDGDGCLQTFRITGKSLKWLRYWLEREQG